MEPDRTSLPFQQVLSRAIEVFEGQGRAAEWMRSPNLALSGQSPAEFLRGGGVPQALLRILSAIERGGVV